jgi:hypothetical protein
MARGAIAFNTECSFSVVAGTAGFILLHLFHSNFFMLIGVGIEFVVAGCAFLTGTGNMNFVAEQDIATFVLEGNVTSTNSRDRRHGNK